MARESLSIALNRASSCTWPLWRAAPPARPSTAFIYGVIVVANASVRLFVSLLVCTKNDLNAVPSFASPW
jgi:hypothetical protein